MTRKTKKQKQPDYLIDVIQAVRAYDEVRLGKREIKGETLDSLHTKAVKAIGMANSYYYPGYMSISKARSVMQAVERREKAELVKEQNEQAA